MSLRETSNVFIKAAINGGRSKAEHVAVPITPEEIAADVVACLQAGATAIHFHTRSQNGNESLAPTDIARALQAIRVVTPKAAIGISTGDWIVSNHRERMRLVAEWIDLPDFASVNFHEVGAVELARTLLSMGVAVEAGLANPEAAALFATSNLAQQSLRVLIEPQEQVLDIARRTVRAIEAVLDEAHIQIPRLLHGTEATAWPILDEAIACGYQTRVGFEDTFELPDNRKAQNNAELVSVARIRSEAREMIVISAL